LKDSPGIERNKPQEEEEVKESQENLEKEMTPEQAQ